VGVFVEKDLQQRPVKETVKKCICEKRPAKEGKHENRKWIREKRNVYVKRDL